MKKLKSKLSQEQIVRIPEEVEALEKVAETCWMHGIRDHAFEIKDW